MTLSTHNPIGPSRARRNRRWMAAVVAVGTLLAGGCAFEGHRRELEALHATGRYDEAARVLDDQRTQGLYGRKDDLLYLLDRGAIALALDDAPGALSRLEAAEAIMDRQHGPSVGDTVVSWLFNDAATTYVGEPYEDIYANVLKLLAQLEAGNIQGGATVEARRAASKADVLRTRYGDRSRAVNEAADPRLRQAMAAGPMDLRDGGRAGPAGEFIESSLGCYLTAVTFMKTGEPENQRVAGRRLVATLQAAQGLAAGVNAGAFESLGELPPDAANVLVVGFSGRGPTKRAQRIGPIPVFDWPVYFELPVLRYQPSEVAGVRVRATPVDVAGETPFETPLSLVENLGAVATENHRRELPLIYARALIRSSAKAGASFAVTQSVRRSNRNNDAAVIASVLGGLAAVALTERADLRCWVFLPGQAHAGLLKLEPGQWRITVDYLSSTGGVIASGPERTVRITGASNELTTIVEHTPR
ncbi:MAG: hypothetical protein KIT68_07090 [Phycisphaeraceae bacterium]|nr:hypothetical protein [Phycisphaeraceae bacterium]